MKTLMLFLTTFLFLFATQDEAYASEKSATRQKAVLVTGATSGIGLRITEHLSQQGYLVYAGARKDKDMKRLNAMKNVKAIQLDVNKHEQIKAAVKMIEDAGTGLYGLVNNAGIVSLSPLIETDEEDLDFLMQVNLYGPYRITKAFAPLIIKSKGRITTISSISGILSGRLFGPYSMSKHAIEAFVDSLAVEMAKFEVSVSAIEPGNFESKIADSFIKRFKKNDRSNKDSLYQKEWQGMLDYFKNRTNKADPIAVAKAVEHALFDQHPKMRYMVVPNQGEADITIRKAMSELVQLNQNHQYSIKRDALIKILDEELAKTNE